MSEPGLVGVKLREVATAEVVYEDCVVLHSDAIGLLFEVERTLSEGGQIETVVSQILIPWAQIKHVVVLEQRT